MTALEGPKPEFFFVPTYAATRIIGTADWRSAIPELLSRLGAATEVSRVYFFEIHAAPNGRGLVQSCRFSWEAPELEPLLGDPRFQNDPIGEEDDPQFADWFKRRSRGEAIQVKSSVVSFLLFYRGTNPLFRYFS